MRKSGMCVTHINLLIVIPTLVGTRTSNRAIRRLMALLIRVPVLESYDSRSLIRPRRIRFNHTSG